MKASTLQLLFATAIVAVLGLGAYFWHQDNEYRRQNGRVTEVNLLTWDQEVVGVKSDKPVLVYFYKEDGQSAAEDKVVHDFAWDNAYDVKVVVVNCAHLENLPLAIAHGALRYPAFVILKGEHEVSGASGSISGKDDLDRLLSQLKKASAP